MKIYHLLITLLLFSCTNDGSDFQDIKYNQGELKAKFIEYLTYLPEGINISKIGKLSKTTEINKDFFSSIKKEQMKHYLLLY